VVVVVVGGGGGGGGGGGCGGGGGGGGGGIVAIIEAENRASGRNSTRPSVTCFDVRQLVLVRVNTGV